MACALIADQMTSVGFLDRDIDYTSGVMHSIGRLALTVIRPQFQRLLSLASSSIWRPWPSKRTVRPWERI